MEERTFALLAAPTAPGPLPAEILAEAAQPPRVRPIVKVVADVPTATAEVSTSKLSALAAPSAMQHASELRRLTDVPSAPGREDAPSALSAQPLQSSLARD